MASKRLMARGSAAALAAEIANPKLQTIDFVLALVGTEADIQWCQR